MARVTLTSRAQATWAEDDRPITDLSQLGLPAGQVVGSFGLDLDWDLIEQGIIGGEVSVRLDQGSRLFVDVHFWAPLSLSSDTTEALKRELVGQWSDGFGEGGIPLATKHGEVLVFPYEELSLVDVKEADDGRAVSPTSRVAIEASHGRLAEVAAAVDAGDDINGELGGYNALHLALQGGHVEVIRFLISRGVDVNRVDRMGHSALAWVALSNHLDDSASTEIARALLARGASWSDRQARERTVEFALSRKKAELARILSEPAPE
jgi:hypothetical protein